MLTNQGHGWTTEDASELYDVPRWGQGYFSVNRQGNLQVHPDRDPDRAIDLKQLMDRLELRGVGLPVMLRFSGILRDRLAQLHSAFAEARELIKYDGSYMCVFPIKVNQHRHVIEQVAQHGREFQFGLEAGSKPELIAVMAQDVGEGPIVCNGFKDHDFVELAMMAQKMGRVVLPVVERYSELDLILELAAKHGVRPTIGFRVKLASRGAGRWQSSAGRRSKFGLTVDELLRAKERLEARGMLDCMQLLHFHLGSQVTNIRSIKTALIEASRIYCSLYNDGAGLRYLDVGGGLGVDYDGSQSNFESSMNYTLQEYANDVLFHVESVCREAGVPHPHIISESGRAVAAYHSALIVPVMGASGRMGELAETRELEEDAPEPLRFLDDAHRNITMSTLLEAFHDAQQGMEMAMTMFSLGHLSLADRCYAEQLFWSLCHRVRRLTKEMDYVPEELRGLDATLSEIYFCNFSVFQSMPDTWAIKQLFPIMPIHRLDREPTQHAVLGDMTCDSDGKVDQFIDRREVRRTLRLHELDDSSDEPYLLGVFLVGAYQEILGDLHNLFGDTHEVHVRLSSKNEVIFDAMLKGDTVSEVLEYVHYNRDQLVGQIQTVVERAVRKGLLTHQEAGQFVAFYEQGLNGYTYLED